MNIYIKSQKGVLWISFNGQFWYRQLSSFEAQLTRYFERILTDEQKKRAEIDPLVFKMELTEVKE